MRKKKKSQIDNNVQNTYKHSASTFEKKSQYDTRNEQKYIVPKCRLDIFKKSLIPDAICKWNVLPNDLIKSSTIGQFRRAYLILPKIALALRISIMENAC